MSPSPLSLPPLPCSTCSFCLPACLSLSLPLQPSSVSFYSVNLILFVGCSCLSVCPSLHLFRIPETFFLLLTLSVLFFTSVLHISLFLSKLIRLKKKEEEKIYALQRKNNASELTGLFLVDSRVTLGQPPPIPQSVYPNSHQGRVARGRLVPKWRLLVVTQPEAAATAPKIMPNELLLSITGRSWRLELCHLIHCRASSVLAPEKKIRIV